MARGFAPAQGRAATADEPTASLQSGLPVDYQRLFEEELGGWFQALKWLIKEFRLHVGYETLDEEAHIRFWIDRYESKSKNGSSSEHPGMQGWPTADEPVLSATAEEVAQARAWPRRMLEEKLSRFFDLRLRICPRIPILVPLRQLQNYDAPRVSSAKQRQSALHQFRAVPVTTHVVARPSEARRSATPSKRPAKVAPCRVRPLSKDTRQRVFPAASIGGQRLNDEQFASRVVDLAIAFDGNAVHASRHGAQFLKDGVMPPAQDVGETFRMWVEGRDSLEDMEVHGGPGTFSRGLVGFWNMLSEKSLLGLLVPTIRAERVLRMRSRGTTFFQDVLRVYVHRFKYECLDAKVLHRFWVSMPPAVKSMHHVRGMAERRALEFLREGVKLRTEQALSEQTASMPKAATTPRKSIGARPSWRPAGDAMHKDGAFFEPELLKSARDAVLPNYQNKGTGLEDLAKPKVGVSPLSLLRRLRRQFPGDTVISRMIRQSLQGWKFGCGAVPIELEAASNQEKLKMLLDPDKAHAAEESLREAFASTRRINRFLSRKARDFLKTAHVTALGPRFGVELLEELFAHLCRFEGTATMLEHFGPAVTDFARPGGLIRAVSSFSSAPALRGGLTTDCSTRKAACCASSSAPGTTPDDAVDGDSSTGWRPDLQLEHRLRHSSMSGATEFKADLGRVHSCVGLVLEWTAPAVKRVEVSYADRLELVADLTLEGGDGERVRVAHVNKGGAASRAGLMRGFVLVFDAGGTSDQLFQDLPAQEAISRMQDPPLVGTPAKLIFDPPVEDVSVQVEVSAQKVAGPRWDTITQAGTDDDRPSSVVCKPGVASEIPCVFVGRIVRLVFPSEWPRLFPGGPELSLVAVRVVKVWRLAPPLFRKRFLEALRNRPEVELQRAAARIAVAGGNCYGQPEDTVHALRERAAQSDDEIEENIRRRPPQFVGPWRTLGQANAFWAPASEAPGLSTSSIRYPLNKFLSCNDRISKSISAYQSRVVEHFDPDFELWVQKKKPEDSRVEEAMQQTKVIRDREFHLSLKKDAMDLKKLVYLREEDARECTFHPRAAGNSNFRVMKFRVDGGVEGKGVQLMNFHGRSAKEHVDGFGQEDFDTKGPGARSEPLYKLVNRRMAFSKARRQFAEGYFEAALSTLKEKFDVDDIVTRFECHAPGCGKKINSMSPFQCMKGCGGYYCDSHKMPHTHDCAKMKVVLQKKADRQKLERERLRDEGKPIPGKELFEKVEAGMVLEVRELAESIREARRAKAKQRTSLERLGRSMRQFGAIRLVERPFRKNMCPGHFRRQRSFTRDGGDATPLLGNRSSQKDACECPLAHHPAELRFAAGESARRRVDWVDRALLLQGQRQDHIVGSDADRTKERERKAQREKGEGEETGLYQKMKKSQREAAARLGRRAQSAPRPITTLRNDYQERGDDVQRAKGLMSQAWSAFDDGDLQRSRWHLRDAASAAAPAAMADLVGGGSSTPRLPPATSASAGGLIAEDGRWPWNDRLFPRLGTDAMLELDLEEPECELLAVAPQAETGRLLRTCERLELLQARREQGHVARHVLDSCDKLDLELLRRSWAQDCEAKLQQVEKETRAVLEELGADAPISPPVEQPPLTLRSGGRTQMCAEMLGTGHCAKGQACPDAHAPAELASHAPIFEEDLYQTEACPAFYHSWERHLAI